MCLPCKKEKVLNTIQGSTGIYRIKNNETKQNGHVAPKQFFGRRRIMVIIPSWLSAVQTIKESRLITRERYN